MTHEQLEKFFTYPLPFADIIRKQRRLRRELLARENYSYVKKRMAILGGSSTQDLKDCLELFLLHDGIQPEFYESEYNKFYEDAVFDNAELKNFSPEMIVLYTSSVNLDAQDLPAISDSETIIQEKISQVYQKFLTIWQSLAEKYHAVIIQNNFDFPQFSPLGNFDGVAQFGLRNFITQLNLKFAQYAQTHENFYVHDLNGLSAKIGLSNFHDFNQYCSYKLASSYETLPIIAKNLSNIFMAILGKTKKCLVLDLDNTMWGGVIGDDGVENIALGHETPEAEAYLAWQKYILNLKNRGIILAVCSKNEHDAAELGFTHPDSVLHVNDFVSFQANWSPKSLNIQTIAKEINIGLDSLVFIDDNPAERKIVRDVLPEVAVPEVNVQNIFSFIDAIETMGYFEPVAISKEDLKRNATYFENKERRELESKIGNYDDFLKSLTMKAEIDEFKPIYFDRIAQLTNKTNQFNVTTRRYTRADIENFAQDKKNYLTLYGRLEDKFGDNGLIAISLGEKSGDTMKILLWLMSCRVLKRDMELAMLDEFVRRAKLLGCKKLVGEYFRTAKNKMVANLFQEFGFEKIDQSGDDTTWQLNIETYENKNRFIAVN